MAATKGSAVSAASRPVNEHRVSLRDRVEDEGFESIADYLNECCSDSVVIALCDEGCEVEPDGRCEHDCPSPLIAAGMI